MLAPILLGVGCIVPADSGFKTPSRHENVTLAGNPERRLTWSDARRAAAQDSPEAEDRALVRDPARVIPEQAEPSAPAPEMARTEPATESERGTDEALEKTRGAPGAEDAAIAEEPPDPVALREAAAVLEELLPACDLVGLTDLFGGASGAPSAIEDLLLDAEDSSVLTVRLRSGTEAEAIELPFDAFRYDVEAMKLLPRADLAELGERLEPAAAAPEPAPAPSPFVALFAEEERTTFAGRVLAIELSVPEGLAEDYVFLKVRDENNHLQRILLGPVWFVMPTTALSTGGHADVRGVATRDSRGGLLVATEVRLGAKPLALRADDGQPLWLEPDPETTTTTSIPMHGLLACDVLVEGAVWGSVTDVVIEGRSGAVRFVCAKSIVDELAGRWVVVPWSRVTLVDGKLELDVDAKALAAAPSIPAGGTRDLAEADVREGVRRYFER